MKQHIMLPKSTLREFTVNNRLHCLDLKGNVIKISSARAFNTIDNYYPTETEDFLSKEVEGREYLYQLLGAAKQMKTIEDLIMAYQKIPLEYQIDYSYFDFSKSPVIEHMDPVWLADRPTPVPTPTPTPPPYAELRLGSRGQEVLDMKQRFFELGYFRTDQFSDQFNANTADTVKQFEKNNGLPVDGVADAVMLGVLFSDSAVGK